MEKNYAKSRVSSFPVNHTSIFPSSVAKTIYSLSSIQRLSNIRMPSSQQPEKASRNQSTMGEESFDATEFNRNCAECKIIEKNFAPKIINLYMESMDIDEEFAKEMFDILINNFWISKKIKVKTPVIFEKHLDIARKDLLLLRAKEHRDRVEELTAQEMDSTPISPTQFLSQKVQEEIEYNIPIENTQFLPDTIGLIQEIFQTQPIVQADTTQLKETPQPNINIPDEIDLANSLRDIFPSIDATVVQPAYIECYSDNERPQTQVETAAIESSWTVATSKVWQFKQYSYSGTRKRKRAD